MRIAPGLAATFVTLALTVALACAAPRSVACGMGGGMMGMGMTGAYPPATDPALQPDPGHEGARLMRSICTQCHGLPAPGLHTAEEWPAVVGRMVRRMRHMGNMGMMHGMGMMGGGMMRAVRAPSAEERDTILAYLAQHAQQPAGEELHAALETPAGETFRAICSQCHALPSPAQHNAQEWPAVVARMKGNAVALGKTVPDEAQAGDIVAFLQEHGRAGE